jgi:protein FAM32A
MAGDDYTSAVGGGLKLKGSKPSGVTKKKKKKDKPKDTDGSTAAALQKALADEERAAATENTGDVRGEDGEEYEPGSGKTEAERKYEEMRRKRVCPVFRIPQIFSLSLPLTAHPTPISPIKHVKR